MGISEDGRRAGGLPVVFAGGEEAAVGSVIAWEPAPPLGAPVDPLAPDCEPGQLTASLAWQGRHQYGPNRAETLGATVRVTNASAAACLLPARPPLRLLDHRGVALEVASVDGAIEPDHFTFPSRWRLQRRPHALLLQPGGSAQMTLDWANWCRPVPTAVSVQLRSADGSRTLVATAPISGAAPPCVDRALPTTWSDPELRPVGPADGTLVGDPTTLHIRLDVPATARAGADLRFQVTLHNYDPLGEATWTVPLRPCPDYRIELGLLGPGPEALWTVHPEWVYALRCEPLGGHLRAGEQATFEMVVTIPGDARPGGSLLTWAIFGRGSIGTEAEVRILEP